MIEKVNTNEADLADRDWLGNSKSIYTTLGASNHSDSGRAENDFYATDYRAIDDLLESGAKLSHDVWEVSCGRGDLSERLKQFGYNVRSSDLFDRGYGESGIDFLKTNEKWNGTILTNPPYKLAKEFCEHALDIVTPGNNIYMFLKLQFLEGKSRKKLFDRKELKTVYVSRDRIKCAKNGDFGISGRSAVAYCWFQFEKGYNDYPTIKWMN